MEAYGKNSSNVISLGPWGGENGFHWDDRVYSTVRQLEIAHGAGIDSIRIEYEQSGTSVWSDKHGGTGGIKTDKVKLEPDEFLTSIHGSYGTLSEWGPTLVRSLTFESNKRTFGPYGIEQGTEFSFPMIGGKIVGFHGMCGWYLDAIGVHFELISKQVPSNAVAPYTRSSYSSNADEKLGYFVQREYINVYNIFLARQNEDYNSYVPTNVSRQNSHSRDQFTSTEPKSKIHALPFPTEGTPSEVAATPTIERIPSNTAAHPTIERIPSKNIKGVMTYGPWGGTGGSVFDDGIYDGIRQIKLSRNVGGMGGIVSIRVCYAKNEYGIWGSKNGGTVGFKPEKINFNYPEEILTHVTGYYGPTMIMGPNIIRSLTFHTNKGEYGPYGEEQGQSFCTKLREGAIVGFHGRKGLFLDAIGVHVIEGKVAIPAKISSSSKSNNKHEVAKFNNSRYEVPKPEVENSSWTFKMGKRAQTEEVVPRVVKDPAPLGTGPWGGDGGKPWDDGVFTGIKQIILTTGQASCSIEIEYDKNGQSVWSIKHGGNGGVMSGQTSQRVKLEYPREVITCISGYYGPILKGESMKVVKSLTFHTSRRKFGPFGEELGTYFTSGTTEGKVVGFHGRSSIYLDAIGVHMQHWLGNHKSKSSSLAKLFY